MLKMAEKEPPQPDTQMNLTCPTTRGQAQIVDYKSARLSGETITWWRCSDCRGWHVLVDHTKKRYHQD